MNAAEIAARFADSRPGYSLVSFGKVGLPHYRIRLRAQVLERKPVPPIEEILMLGISRGIDEREMLRQLLGLDPPLFDGLLAELLRKDHLLLNSGGAELALTENGKQVLADAREIGPVTIALEISFDALLRSVVPSSRGLIDAHRIGESGLPEVPPAKATPPELGDLDPRLIEREELGHPGGDELTADLLALKRVDRRSRAFRPAVLLVYRAETAGEVQVSIAIDGEISIAHERAFAAARLLTRAGVRRSAMEHPAALFAKVFGREVEDNRAAIEKDEQAAALLPCHKAPALLRETLDQPRKRILIISPKVTAEIIDTEFLESLRTRLVEGTHVAIGVGPPSGNLADEELQRSAWNRLERLYRNFGNFSLTRISRPGPSILARDEELAVLTRFDWLGHEGYSRRRFVDERGLLLDDAKLIEELFEAQLGRFS